MTHIWDIPWRRLGPLHPQGVGRSEVGPRPAQRAARHRNGRRRCSLDCPSGSDRRSL